MSLQVHPQNIIISDRIAEGNYFSVLLAGTGHRVDAYLHIPGPSLASQIMRPTLIPQNTLGKLLVLVTLAALLWQHRKVGFAIGFLLAGIWLFVMLIDVNESTNQQ